MNARPLRRRALTVLRVRVRPGHKTHGILMAGHVAVPVVLGRGGMQKIVDLKLNEAEHAMLVKSAEDVRKGQSEVAGFIS